MPHSTIKAICESVCPIRMDFEINQDTTGSHISGITHHSVRVRNCLKQKKSWLQLFQKYDIRRLVEEFLIQRFIGEFYLPEVTFKKSWSLFTHYRLVNPLLICFFEMPNLCQNYKLFQESNVFWEILCIIKTDRKDIFSR